MSANAAILTLNTGSSSLKYALFDAQTLDCLTRGNVNHHDSVRIWEEIRRDFPERDMAAVCHRLVHGGMRYSAPILLNDTHIEELKQLIPLAPLHLKPELEAVDALAAMEDAPPQIACFDTAFHATQSRLARLFAIPRHYAEEGIIRYGFHGLSYEYIASQLPDIVGEKAHGRVVVAHLGNGASLCAMRNGESIATSMGFTALDGLMMGTRCGSIDPGALLYLLEQKGMSVQALDAMLNRQSGLLGVSGGISHDIRVLERSDAPEAQEAIDLFCYRAAAELGKLVMLLGGLDTLVFTAGIGENSPAIRQKISDYMGWLGVALDAKSNAENQPCISQAGSKVAVYVIPTNEEIVMARHTKALLSTLQGPTQR